MSRRRRSSGQDDSLDLLLDTITNAFGGIVFMAILVAILVRVDAPESAESNRESPLESVERLRKKESLEARIASASETVAQLETRADQLPPTLASDYSRLQDLERQFEAASALRERLTREEAEVAQEVREQASSNENLQIRAAELRGEIEEMEERLARETERRTTTSELPRERSTDKRQIAFLFRRGRIVRVTQGFSINATLEPTEESRADLIAPGEAYRVGASSGFPQDDLDRFRAELTGLNPDDDYLAVGIWDDSFESYTALRKLMVEAGIEHSLLVMRDGQAIRLGGGGPGRVQ